MAQTSEQAYELISEAARQMSGRRYERGRTTIHAAGHLFQDHPRVMPDGRHLEILTVDGKQGFGLALDHWCCVISFGRKAYATTA